MNNRVPKRPVRTKADLLRALDKDPKLAGLSKAMKERILNDIVNAFSDFLYAKENISIRGIGTFTLCKTNKNLHNFRTDEFERKTIYRYKFKLGKYPKAGLEEKL